MNALIKILPMLICLIILSACAGSDFKKAKQANSYDAYKEFLSEHPSSSLASEARRLQEISLWNKAKADNTLEGYNNYLDTYPEGKFKDAAITAREPFIYKRACESDESDLYREYISYYPNGKYKEAANNRLVTLAAYDRIANAPTKYVSITIYPVNEFGKMLETPIVSYKKEEPSLLRSGVIGSTLLSALGFQGASASTTIRVVPTVESKADIPLEVNFDVTLSYKQSTYNSMYQYTPSGGWATGPRTATRNVTEQLKPRENKVGSVINLGEFKLAEEGQTFITVVKIRREIKSISAKNIHVKSPMTDIEQSYCSRIIVGSNVASAGFSETLAGVWEGNGKQNNGAEWSILFTSDGHTFSIEYPSLSCSGTWQLLSETQESATFLEYIQVGVDKCLNEGTVTLSQLEPDKLRFDYAKGNSTSYGELLRTSNQQLPPNESPQACSAPPENAPPEAPYAMCNFPGET